LERQRIRDQIGALEEQLEQLHEISLANGEALLQRRDDFNFQEDIIVGDAQAAVRGLQDLLQEQSLEKSIPAQDFLKRVVAILLREASAAGHEVALTTFGTGRISLDMVEISMGAIMACLRSSIRGLGETSQSQRIARQLFRTFSINLEIRATADEVYFRVADDGRGLNQPFPDEFEGETQFQKIRTHISRFGGWFRRRTLAPCGGMIEFKIPMARGRFDCLLLKGSGFEILVPNSCVAEIRQGENFPAGVSGRLLVASLHEAHGLTKVVESGRYTVAVRVAVADFQFWIRCEGFGDRVRARRNSAEGFIEPGTWLKNFGIFQDLGVAKVLPLLEGEAMMSFHLENGGGHEGN
jgi:hypothetical protein